MIEENTDALQRTMDSLARQVEAIFDSDQHLWLQRRQRYQTFCETSSGILLDWSHQWVDDDILDDLCDIAEQRRVIQKLHEQCNGALVNYTEQRRVLHTALRGTNAGLEEATKREIKTNFEAMVAFANDVRNEKLKGFWRDPFESILHIGIGGSHLGQALLQEALGEGALPIHFLSNVDDETATSILQTLNPRSTLIFVASKSMRTAETLRNFELVEAWFTSATKNPHAFKHHCVCLTSNQTAALQFGNHHFPIPDYVGGRFSIWSAMALPILVAHGIDTFRDFLEGAREADHDALHQPPRQNLSLLLALFAFFNIELRYVSSHVIASYIPQMRQLVPYLQQLELESNGKPANLDNESTSSTTVALWGGEETNGQHAWHQFLHQGTSIVSVDLLATTEGMAQPNNRWNIANCLAQRHLFFHGHSDESEERTINGHHGCNLLILDRVNTKTLGKLLATYEHKVAFLGFLWGINSYDQFGVEQGKILAEMYDQELVGKTTGSLLESDLHLIDKIRQQAID